MKTDIQGCQRQLMRMAVIFDGICSKYNIPYYMLGGTMLGAVRHKGFIPWDDDMDFGIPRPDFNRFLKVAEQELPAGYSLHFPIRGHQYVKIRLNNSRIIDEREIDYREKGLYRGMAIDIFPLDGADDNTLLGKLHIKITVLCTRILNVKNCSLRHWKGVKKLCAYLIKKLPVSDRKLNHFIDRWIQKKEYGTASKVVVFCGAYKEKEVMDKSVLSQSCLYPFEQIRLRGVVDYHKYLTNLYGDYMQLPPVEVQLARVDTVYLLEE